jgi:hypothetical protein
VLTPVLTFKQIILAIPFLILAIVGLYMLISSYQHMERIVAGKETKIRNIVFRSAVLGFSATLIFFSGIFFFTAIFNEPFEWSLGNLLKSFAFFSVGGIIIFFGSLWQFFLISKYRDILIKIIKRQK